MSKIKELLKSDDSILVFDVDGVLAVMEFDEYNHFMPEEKWNSVVGSDYNCYTEERVSKKLQDFIRTKDKNRIYVVTKINDQNEENHKKEYVNKYYGILKENLYCVKSDYDKADSLKEIKEKYKDLEEFKLLMIDDSVTVLDDVMEKTNFSTVHVSSLLDI